MIDMEFHVTQSGIKGGFLQIPASKSILCSFDSFTAEYNSKRYILRKNMASRIVNKPLMKQLNLNPGDVVVMQKNPKGVFIISKK